MTSIPNLKLGLALLVGMSCFSYTASASSKEDLTPKVTTPTTAHTAAEGSETQIPTKRLQDLNTGELKTYKEAFNRIYTAVEYGRIVDPNYENLGDRLCHASKFSLIHWVNKHNLANEPQQWFEFRKTEVAYDLEDQLIKDEKTQRELVMCALYFYMETCGVRVSDFDQFYHFSTKTAFDNRPTSGFNKRLQWISEDIISALYYTSTDQIPANDQQNCVIF